MDLDQIELPENHPFAVKKKLTPGGFGDYMGEQSYCSVASCPTPLVICVGKWYAQCPWCPIAQRSTA